MPLPNTDVAPNDIAEQALLEQRARFPEPDDVKRHSSAVDNFFTGAAAPPSSAPPQEVIESPPLVRKRSKQTPRPQVEEHDTPVLELAKLLLTSQERITLTFDTLTLQFSVFVHVSADATSLTLLGWGANRVQLQLHDMASQVIKITRQSGQVHNAMYLGASVTLGLHGTLISFMLVHHDD